MSAYKTSRKVRYTSAIVFIIFMSFIVGGTLLSQSNQAVADNSSVALN